LADGKGEVPRKTPGVFIQEVNAFPNSVVEVETAVPTFVGYVEKVPASSSAERITSLVEYRQIFGGPPATRFTFADTDEVSVDPSTRFLLDLSLRLFFENGGGPCWILPIGTYDLAMKAGKSKEDFLGVLPLLEKNSEATMLVSPDAVLLGEEEWGVVSRQFLEHCGKMQSRVAILDVYDGFKSRTHGDDDVVDRFRQQISGDSLKYGAAYYPWLNTSVTEEGEVDFRWIGEASRGAFETALLAGATDQAKATVSALLERMARAEASALPEVAAIHGSLMVASPLYVEVMRKIRAELDLLPPSAGMAGVWTRVDSAMGVFKAPANTGVNSVVSATVEITNEDQQDLNVPLDGKAINAIRSFAGRGLLVWGARTLDGNSQDWRYINVRRTMIMLEQSIKLAVQAYVFAANDALTWVTVTSMIENFLTNQWKEGALVGAKPADAFDVKVGLGSTMTADDILNGYMNVTVLVAMVRPAEFIVLTFQQQMATP